MSKQITENVLFFVGVILYNIFFWKEQMGLNTLLFSIFVIGSIFYLHPESRHSTIARLTALGTVFTAVMVVIFNSQFSKIVHILSLIAMVGFVQQRELRFLWYALLLTVQSVLSVPMKVFRKLKNINIGNKKTLWKLSRNIRLAIVPMFFVFVFFMFYVVSNSAFENVVGKNMEYFFDWLYGFSLDFNPSYFFFFMGSLFVVGGIIWRTQTEWLVALQKKHQENIVRKRQKVVHYIRKPSMIGLKNEYRSALMMLISLNALTLLVNITDIQNIWLGYSDIEARHLWRDVHYGTYTLIFTIFMAMGVLLYFFRKNLNFYKKNQWLKIAAIVWMAQNILLTLSVALRNIKYINHFGLTYKRIGVFIFLALVIYGLGTMIFKVNRKKSAYYLFQHNAWTMYIVLVLLTSVNWDMMITHFNLNLKSGAQPDYRYIAMELSDKNLPVLYRNSDIFSGDIYTRPYSFENVIEQKTKRFFNKKTQQTWWSWNLADHNTLLYLEKHKKRHLAD